MTKLINKLYIKGLIAKQNLKRAIEEERGEANIIAMVLILAIVIALVLIFKEEVTDIVKGIMGGFSDDINDAIK